MRARRTQSIYKGIFCSFCPQPMSFKHRRRCCLFVVLVLISLGYLGIKKAFIAPNPDNPTHLFTPQQRYLSKEHPLILYWGTPWGAEGYTPPDGSRMGKCEVTNDRSKLDQSDIVVFHYTVVNHEMMPWKYYRDAKQVFVWWSAENPAMLQAENIDLTRIDRGFFNWTWTYRLDADVHRGYGYRGNVINAVSKGKKVVDDILAAKSKLAIWLVSNCDRSNGARMRFKYSQELVDAGLDLTRIGKCFENHHLLPREDEQANAGAIREHKFYMTFENAWHCTDYLTEKFWELALLNDAVPVIWGPAKIDVLRVAPIDSFIHVEDFDSAADLVKHLQYLDKHDAAYRAYFRWREDQSMTDDKMISMIRERYPDVQPQTRPVSLCEKFMLNSNHKTIDSLFEEFVLANPKTCYEKEESWFGKLKDAIVSWALW